jgi:tetraacyldisaccharide 4'-kinase
VFTRMETVPGTGALVEQFAEHPVFSAATRLVGFRRMGFEQELIPAEGIGYGPFYAFCGIGNPKAYFQDLKNWKFELTGRCEFPDHHRYDQRDATEIEAAAIAVGAKGLLTTEKDAQNLAGTTFAKLPVYFSVIDLLISKEAALLGLLHQKLGMVA